MNKNELELFINSLNSAFNNNCSISFDINSPYICCFNPQEKLIVCNDNINQEEDFLLGEYKFKYFILHEYGHALFNNKIKVILQKVNNIDKNDNFICEYDEMIDNFRLSEIEYYKIKQFRSTCEFIADYFVIKNILKYFNYLNIIDYKKWRALTVLSLYNNCQTLDCLHYEGLSYYHIPQTIINNNINFVDDSLEKLVSLSLLNSHELLLLQYDQVNDYEKYLQNGFDKKLIKIINEL